MTLNNQQGFVKFFMTLAILLIGAVVFRSVTGHALSATAIIKSGDSGYCMDVFHGETTANAVVDSANCNGTKAQAWSVSGDLITHEDSCLTIPASGTAVGTKLVISDCDQAAGQVWLSDKGGYFNPNSGLCLSLPSNATVQQLVIADCANLGKATELWSVGTSDKSGTVPATTACNQGTEGQRVACYAEKEWTTWQSGSPNHEALLTSYTDGTPYEEWCADFVSYVYKEAGYPFTEGSADGWDENNANDVQDMGFTIHQAGSYTPQVGDVAYFDYNGGHVEIVVSGGAHPTFVYGDSATTDPTTGNGDMKANTITQDGALGQVMYYLSPD